MEPCVACRDVTITPILPQVDPATRNPSHPFPLFPNDTDLAHMANIEYSLKSTDKCLHSCYLRMPHGGKKGRLETKCSHLIDGGWILLATFQKLGKFLQGYCGSAFFNTRHHQLVIVHRGTNGVTSMATDILAVFRNNLNDMTGFTQTGYWFTNEVIKKYGAAARSVTVTGHSLGGWLAQAATFLTKYPQYQCQDVISGLRDCAVQYKVESGNLPEARHWKHLHCVCFDSPGFKEAIETTIPKLGKLHGDRLHLHRHLDSLDVTVYLVEDFTVGNFFHNQIGSVFVMQTVKVHSSDVIVQFWLDYDKHIQGNFEAHGPEFSGPDILEVQEQKRVLSSADTKPRDILVFRMSVFDEAEREMCRTILGIRESLKGSHEWKKYFPNETFLGNAYALEHDCQIMNAHRRYIGPFKVGCLLSVKDQFIQEMKFHLSQFRKLPEYLGWCMRVNCEQYRASLAEFGEAVIFQELEILKMGSQKLNILHTNARKGQVVAAKLRHIWRHDLENDPFSFLFLDSKTLVRLHKIHPAFNAQTARMQKDLVLIECKDDVDAYFVQDFILKLCKSSLIKKVILIVSNDSKNNLADNITGQGILNWEDIVEKEISEDETTVRFCSLNEEAQKALNAHHVIFKRTHVTLGSLSDFYSLNDISEFFQCEPILIGTKVPELNEFENSYFIDRTFRKLAVESSNLADLPDKIILLGDREVSLQVVQSYVWGCKGQYEGQKFITIQNSEMVSYFDIKKFTQDHECKAHLFRIEENCSQLVWLNSFGDVDLKNLRTFVKATGEFPFEMILQPYSQLRIIADEPGKGKSIIMRKLATLAQLNKIRGQDLPNQPPWTIFVDLSKAKSALRDLKRTPITLDTILQFLAKLEARSTSIRLTIGMLRTFVQETFRVKLFLDGFDEIPHDLQKVVQNLLDVLLDETHVQVLLATRTYMQIQLENGFGQFCFPMLDLDERQQIDFLVSFWTNHPDFEKNRFHASLNERYPIIHTYAEQLLHKFKRQVGDAALKLIGVPLQSYMLAQISMAKSLFRFMEHLVDSSLQTGKSIPEPFLPDYSNTFDFYKMFVHEKLRIALEEKYGVGGNELHPHVRDSVIRKLRKLHRKCSFEFIFGVEILEEYFKCRPVKWTEDPSGLFIGGIVLQADDTRDRFIFLHRTLAEYFAADFIVTNVINEKEKKFLPNERLISVRKFLDSYLLTEEYGNIKYFVDSLILQHESTPEIFKCMPRLKQLQNDEAMLKYLKSDKVEVDCFDRTILHWAMQRERLSDISWFVTKCKRMTDRRDWFNATPFAYLLVKDEFKDACRKLHSSIDIHDRRDKLPTGKTERCLVLGLLLVNRWKIWRGQDGSANRKLLSKYPVIISALDRIQSAVFPISYEYSSYECLKSCKDYKDYQHKYLNRKGPKDPMSLLEILSLRDVNEDILEFAETQADLLSDLNIVIRRNGGVPWLPMPNLIDNVEVENLFQSVCSLIQREGLIVDLYRLLHDVRDSARQKHVESVFLEFLQKDNFKNYKRMIRSQEMDDQSREKTLWYLIKPKGKVTFGSDLFNVFYETDFVSLQRIYNLFGHDWFLEDFLDCISSIPIDHVARQKILSICSENLARISQMKDLDHDDGTKALVTLKYYNDESRQQLLKKYHDLFDLIICEERYHGVPSIIPAITQFLISEKRSSKCKQERTCTSS